MRVWLNFAAAVMVSAGVVGGMASVAHAEPGGCVKYGAAGAVAGHLAGHHAVLGAVAGCAVGMYKRHEYRKHEKEASAHAWAG